MSSWRPAPRHFLKLSDLAKEETEAILRRAKTLKAMRTRREVFEPLRGRTLAMIFEKNSTRTRVSFEVGMAEMGGHALFLSAKDTHLGRGEPVEDVARVVSRMVDAVMIRTFAQKDLALFAKHSLVPVINGLTDEYHPCQLLADLLTMEEKLGSLEDITVAWVGDSNNVCNSWIEAAKIFSFPLHIATPPRLEPEAARLADATSVRLFADPMEAASGADVVVTDVWTSMGFEKESEARKALFSPYRVDQKLMAQARPRAIFMHCLPAHRGEEVEEEVLMGPQSAVWEEAENRLHVQKALLEFLILENKE